MRLARAHTEMHAHTHWQARCPIRHRAIPPFHTPLAAYITATPTRPFVVLPCTDFVAGVCNFSRAKQACCRTPGEKLRLMRTAEGKGGRRRKKNTHTHAHKLWHEETSNCFPCVMDPVTRDDRSCSSTTAKPAFIIDSLGTHASATRPPGRRGRVCSYITWRQRRDSGAKQCRIVRSPLITQE